VRFGDLLRATVMLSAGSATLLAAIAVIGIGQDAQTALIAFCAAWWVLAAAMGVALGGRAEAAIQRLLAGARSQTSLPEVSPARALLNRLWPLLISTIGAAVLGVWAPQVAAIAAGFAIVWALAWRRQEHAVAAIEERDGVRFYVDRTSPFAPMRLIRTPGFGGKFIQSPS
jgi:hypothetical protein